MERQPLIIRVEPIDVEGKEFWIPREGKRKIRTVGGYPPDATDVQEELMDCAMWFVRDRTNAKSLLNMTSEKFIALLERHARSFCGIYAPTRDYGLEKKYIRGAMLSEMLRMYREEEGGGDAG